MIPLEFKRAVTPWFTGEKPTFATVLNAVLAKMYGADYLNWDALTIQLEVKDTLDVDMPRKVFDQLMGMVTALTSTVVYHDVEAFDAYVSAANRLSIAFDHDLPSVADVAWAVTELHQVDPEPVGVPKRGWSDDIRAYTRVILDAEGMPIAPKALSFAKDRAPQGTFSEDAPLYAGAWESSQARADEIDGHVDYMTTLMIAHLAQIGVKPYGEQPAQPGPQSGRIEKPYTADINKHIFDVSTRRKAAS